MLAGIDWALDRNVDVINMSLGALVIGPETPGTYTRAIVDCFLRGVPVVAAIGNEGDGTGGSPGNDLFALSVGATDTDDVVAGFSSGRTQIVTESTVIRPELLPLPYPKPDLGAPGVAVESSVPGGDWGILSGTSMATPHASGAVALLLSATGELAGVGAERDRVGVIIDLMVGRRPPARGGGSGPPLRLRPHRRAALDRARQGTGPVAAVRCQGVADRIDAVIEDGSLRRLAHERSADERAGADRGDAGRRADADVAVGRGGAVDRGARTVDVMAVRTGAAERTPPDGAVTEVCAILGRQPRYLRAARRSPPSPRRPAGGAGGQPAVAAIRPDRPLRMKSRPAAPYHRPPWGMATSARGQPEVAELRRREALAQRMGGPEKIARQHDGGKLTVRERIDALLDPGSFHEVGAIAGKATYDGRRAGRPHARPTSSWAGAASTAGPSWSAATTSPCAAAPPTPRSGRSRSTPSRWQRAAAADRAPRRRHRWRRQRQDARHDGPHLRARQPRLGVRRRQPRRGARRRARPRLRRRARAPPASSPATTR